MMEGLEDDGSGVFKGGTLEITPENAKSKENLAENVEKIDSKTKIWDGISPVLAFPKKNTLWSCKDNPNGIVEQHNTSLQVLPVLNKETPSDFFTFRDGVVEKAVKDCTEALINPELDGEIIGNFLLTEISLWDAEKERLVILTSKYIFSIKYDFIALKQIEYRKIALDTIDSIVSGDLVYPTGSIIPRLNGIANGLSEAMKGRLLQKKPVIDEIFQPRNRNSRGIQIMWNKGEPIGFKQKWNPFSSSVPFFTFTSHPLYNLSENLEDAKRSIYGFEDFQHYLVQIVEINQPEHDKNVIVHHKDIILHSYLGLGSLIHNRNALGFFKVRGKFSF